VSDTDSLLTTAEAAQRLGVPFSTLAYWRAAHTGPRYIRLGEGVGRVRYRPTDLDAYAAAKSVEPVNA
jgi:predicted DNA-binding transcriptional regulator AlpA